jgi:hypothetical protein
MVFLDWIHISPHVVFMFWLVLAVLNIYYFCCPDVVTGLWLYSLFR